MIPDDSPSWLSHQSLEFPGVPIRLTLTLLPPSTLGWEITFPEFWLPFYPSLTRAGKAGVGRTGQGWGGEASWALFVSGDFPHKLAFYTKGLAAAGTKPAPGLCVLGRLTGDARHHLDPLEIKPFNGIFEGL